MNDVKIVSLSTSILKPMLKKIFDIDFVKIDIKISLLISIFLKMMLTMIF